MHHNHKVKVLVIYHDEGWGSGGSDIVLKNLIAILNKDKYRILCGIITNDPERATRSLPEGVEAVTFHIPEYTFFPSLKFYFRLSAILKKHRIQIIHVNGDFVKSLYAEACQRVPITIVHWHGSYGLHKRKTRLKCRFWGYFTDLNIAVSNSTKAYVMEKLGFPPDRIKVIHNGIDVAAFQGGRPREMVRRDLGVPLETPVVGIVARLSHWGKGHKELFSAMEALRPQHTFHALIVGDGGRRSEMEKMVQEMGLADVVHFLGMRHDIADLLAAMNIFVLPGSHGEGISLSILEAMASGLPVIASRVGGTPEIIRHEENGLLIPVGDSQSLADSLTRLLEDPTFARKLGEVGRKDVQGYFSLERMGREIHETYEALIREKLTKTV